MSTKELFQSTTPSRVDHLLIAEMVEAGSRVLDVGCGDGALLQLLNDTKAVDGRGVELSRLCQGAFGLMTAGGEDARVLAGIARALKPGGRLALSAFNAYFAVKYHTEATFDADLGISHERTEVRNESGVPMETDLWTACYTPRELRLLCASVGLEVDDIWAVTPGDYAQCPPSTETPEHLVLARRR